MANDDELIGKAKELGGKVQKNVGDVTDNPDQQAKGQAKETEGKAQNLGGKVKEGISDAVDNVKDKLSQ